MRKTTHFVVWLISFQSAGRDVVSGNGYVGIRIELPEVLHQHWLKRERVVIELAVDKQSLMRPENLEVEPYHLDPDFEFSQERLHFLT